MGAPTLTRDFSTGRWEKRLGFIRGPLGISLGIYPGAARDIAWDLSGGRSGNRLGFFRWPLRRSPSIFGIALGVSEHVPRHFPFKIPGDLELEAKRWSDMCGWRCGVPVTPSPPLMHAPRYRALAATSVFRSAGLWGMHMGAGGRGDRVGLGYSKPPPEVGRLNVLQACRAVGSGQWAVGSVGSGGGGSWGLGGGGGGGLGRCRWPCHVGGGRGAAKGPPPFHWSPTGVQPMACTLALWWLRFGPTEGRYGGTGMGGWGGTGGRLRADYQGPA